MVMKQSTDSYIFKGAFDAFVYLIISAIIPVTYMVIDLVAVSGGNIKTFVAAALTLMSFFASCSYDYVSRYDDERETKKPAIYNVLFIGILLYAVIAIGTLVGIILVVTDTVKINDIKSAYYLFFCVGLYAPVVSLVDVCRYMSKKHKNKLAKARSV